MTESVMVIVTVASLALALAMGLMLAMLLRHERRRSDARAALLAEMAAEAAPPDTADDLLSDFADEFTGDASIPQVSGADLFAAPRAASAWPQRFAIVGTLALTLVVIGALARGVTTTRPTGAAPVAEGPASSADAALLDLLSLRHTQEAGALTITGLVQNPRTGAPLSKITATAMVFGADDTFIASGRTPLDLTTLRPGDESGFVVSVPLAPDAAGAVSRYRIGFRGEDGRIIGHVDRRVSTAIARGPS